MTTATEIQIGLLVLLIVPIIILHFKQTNFRYFILSFIIITSFIAGSLELLGIISYGNLGVVREFFIVLLFIQAFPHKKINGFKYINILPLIFLIYITFLSAIVNSTSIIKVILFARIAFMPMIFFIALYNYPLQRKYYIIFRNLIVYLFLLQIPVNIGKYFIIGKNELVIGSMSITGGGLTTIFTLIGISFSFAYYIRYKKFYYLILCVGFYISAIIGRKRAIFVFIPLILIVIFFLYRKYFIEKTFFPFRKILLVIILSFSAIYVSLRTFPKLNPEHTQWGSFDINYALSTSWRYSVYKTTDDANYYGRLDGYRAIKEVILRKYGISKLMLGLGPGEIIPSRFLSDVAGVKSSTISGRKYDIGYGSKMVFTWLLLQIGLLGALCYFFYYFKFFKLTLKLAKHPKMHGNDKVLLLGFMGVYFIYLLDFFLYSNTTLKLEPIFIPFMFFLSYFLRYYDFQNPKHQHYSFKKHKMKI